MESTVIPRAKLPFFSVQAANACEPSFTEKMQNAKMLSTDKIIRSSRLLLMTSALTTRRK